MAFLLKYTSIIFVLLFSVGYGQNQCPITGFPEWPVGNEESEYFDNTLSPVHSEPWRSSWMSQLNDDRDFNDITVPGTHQSSSHYWSGWSQCNTWSIPDQLRAGLRYIDVRTEQIYDELQIWHTIIDQFNCLDNVIQEMVDFLETNPSEFIMLRLDHYNDQSEGNTMTFTEAVLAVTDLYDQNLFWKESTFPSTIGDARKKIILFRNWNDNGMWGLEYGQNSVIEDNYDIENRDDLEAKWEGIVEHLNVVPEGNLNTLYIMYNSGSGVLWTPSRVAQETNQWMYEHLPTLDSPSRRGIILFDFPGYDIIGDVIQFNEDVSV